MKPFDLEKALAGEPVVTRDGDKVTGLVKFNTDESSESLAGIVNGFLRTWHSNGSYCNLDETGYDLFMKSKTVVKWVNIYLNRDDDSESAFLHDSEEEANSASLEDERLGNKAHRIEWEE